MFQILNRVMSDVVDAVLFGVLVAAALNLWVVWASAVIVSKFCWTALRGLAQHRLLRSIVAVLPRPLSTGRGRRSRVSA